MTIMGKYAEGNTEPEIIFMELVGWVDGLLKLLENKDLEAPITAQDKKEFVEAFAAMVGDVKILKKLDGEFPNFVDPINERIKEVQSVLESGIVRNYGDLRNLLLKNVAGPIGDIVKSRAPNAARALYELAA